MIGSLGWRGGLTLIALVICSVSGPSYAGPSLRSAKAVAPAASVPYAEIRRALDEGRLLDASKMMDRSFVSGADTPELLLLAAELNLARGRYEEALAGYRRAAKGNAPNGDAFEGQGIALSLLGRSDEALTTLRTAVEAKPSAWRAWNALGRELDARQQWPQAESAFERALTESNRAPIALNNRGYSRLLQGRVDDAIKDFVEALAKKPDLSAARTNLRMAIAMRGEYDRAIAGASQESEAATLNNAGYAAMVRGDYETAESLFDRAMRARGEYYGRAAANLQLSRSLQARTQAVEKAAPHEP